MNITVIGTGYVGLVTGTCLADIGNHVVCLDLDAAKIDTLNAGGIPIYEPGLSELVERNRSAGRLRFTTDVREAVEHAEVQFIAVGTPPGEDGSADLRHVLACARSIGAHMDGFRLVVTKSTVPVGTGERVRMEIESVLRSRPDAASLQFAIASNPEFLKEGAAVEDFMRPDRIIVGLEHGAPGERAREILRRLYAPFNRNHERTLYLDLRSAEFTKYAANAMLATRISFMNDLANLAEAVGVDIEQVRKGIGSDPRIGYSFLYAGTGYGGSCFPKDLRALMHTAEEHGSRLRVLDAVEAVNDSQKHVLVDKILRRFGLDLRGRRFGIWGLAFKPNTDDMREAPSRIVIGALLRAGASVQAHDPVATAHCRAALESDFAQERQLLDRISYVKEPQDAAEGADALVIVTEWKAYRSPDFARLKAAMASPVIIDGRNLYEPEQMIDAGFEYQGVGRGVRPRGEPNA
jgi:UDPglucose 6-dehydrogenase